MSLPSTEALTDRKFLQGLDRRLDEERHEAELHAVLLLEAILVARAQFVDRLQVDFVERGQQRLRGLRLHHALGDARAQARHRHALLGARAAARRGCATAASPAGRRAAGASGLPTGRSTTSDFVTRPSRPEPAILRSDRACSPRPARRTAGLSLARRVLALRSLRRLPRLPPRARLSPARAALAPARPQPPRPPR